MSDAGHFVLTVHVSPRSSQDRHVLLEGNTLRVWLTTPPVDGAANKALIRYLAKTLGLPPTSLTLVSGETSRTKRIRIPVPENVAIQKLMNAPELRKR
jgi:uncharacterized protein